MPFAEPPATVLVTGASGFIAAWVVKTFLEKGYSVVGTVRSPSKGDYLKNLFKSYEGKFSYVIVEDIAKEDAFDEAVKNVDAIAHTASPFHMQAKEPDELLIPAIQGTVGILKSALKNGTKVKRVVITSSVAAALRPVEDGYAFTEKDWNEHDPSIIKEKGKDAPPSSSYMASKTLAERAAWDFMEKNKGEAKFDLVTIMPPFVFGPTIHEVSSPEQLNTSIAFFYKFILHPSETLDRNTVLSHPGSCIDVRDVAKAHVEAIARPGAASQRFITSIGAYSWQDFMNILSETDLKDKVNKGYPDTPNLKSNPKYSSGEKARAGLGIEYITKKQMVLDTANSLLERFPQ